MGIILTLVYIGISCDLEKAWKRWIMYHYDKFTIRKRYGSGHGGYLELMIAGDTADLNNPLISFLGLPMPT